VRAGQQRPQALRLGLGAVLRGRAGEALGYPAGIFPDAASWLVDEERRAGFEAPKDAL
jgi:hypothetical protein